MPLGEQAGQRAQGRAPCGASLKPGGAEGMPHLILEDSRAPVLSLRIEVILEKVMETVWELVFSSIK